MVLVLVVEMVRTFNSEDVHFLCGEYELWEGNYFICTDTQLFVLVGDFYVLAHGGLGFKTLDVPPIFFNCLHDYDDLNQSGGEEKSTWNHFLESPLSN